MLEEQVNLDEIFVTRINWRRWWRQIPEIILFVCGAGLPILVTTNVVARYTDWYQVPWTNDVIRVLFMWIVFLGGAVAVRYEAHVKMGLIVDRVAKRGPAGRWWLTATRVSPIAMGLILLILGIRVVELDMHNQLTWLEIPLGYFATIIPASGALMVVYSLQILKKAVRDGGAQNAVPSADVDDVERAAGTEALES